MSFEEAQIIKERAEAFLKNVQILFEEGIYDLAAFNIEQYCQLILKYKLLIKTGTYPRTYSIIRLIKEPSKIDVRANKLLQDIIMITKIEDAYIGSRYLSRRYEKEEVETMLKYAKEIFEVFINEI
ncbi:MAG: HEPN domain-containing protein [Candidatus Methanomethylicaceae archaeon]